MFTPLVISGDSFRSVHSRSKQRLLTVWLFIRCTRFMKQFSVVFLLCSYFKGIFFVSNSLAGYISAVAILRNQI